MSASNPGVPTVVIVGRPNVGKSSLINRLAKRRISIVEETPGVTRDRVSTRIQVEDRPLEIVDTGGIGIVDEQNLSAHVQEQIDLALEQGDIVLFLVDAKEGIHPLDENVARLLRRSHRKVLLVANKVEGRVAEQTVHEFYRLGMGEPLLISAKEGHGVPGLLSQVLANLPEPEELEAPGATDDAPAMKLAIVGQRNAGKSTLVNFLAEEDRVIVSEIPGTTRDAVDVLFERDGRRYLAIDTAGMRRKSSIQGSIEFYSQHRAERSIRRADVVLHLFDVTRDISEVDKKIADHVRAHHKPCILVGNKWDLVQEWDPSEFSEYVRKKLPFLFFCPIVFVSAKEGDRIGSIIDLAHELFDQARHRVPTAEVNRVLQEAVSRRAPKPSHGKIAKFYYGSQTDVQPPTFALFLNDPELVPRNYLRYLENRFRGQFPFEEVPLRLVLRKRQSMYEKEGSA
ncbi:MAG: ribosome biogenesis GTPase Der [Planctomycetota bacterium]